jgi:type I restriction enzyme, R subunit
VGKEKVERYKNDERLFAQLRVAVQSRYTDVIDYRQYEKQIQKMIDWHVSTREVIRLTDQVNIFDQQAFKQEVEKVTGTAARADTIASRTAKHISEHVDEDPVFYTKFGTMLQKVIEDFHEHRISELEYLNKATEIMEKAVSYTDQSIPESLKTRQIAQAFYRTVGQVAETSGVAEMKPYAEEIAGEIDLIISDCRIVDWTYKDDVINKMKHRIDDFLFDLAQERKLNLGTDVIDEIIDKTIEIAKHRY